MSFQVRFTEETENDLIRLYELILNREAPDWTLAARAIDARAGPGNSDRWISDSLAQPTAARRPINGARA